MPIHNHLVIWRVILTRKGHTNLVSVCDEGLVGLSVQAFDQLISIAQLAELKSYVYN